MHAGDTWLLDAAGGAWRVGTMRWPRRDAGAGAAAGAEHTDGLLLQGELVADRVGDGPEVSYPLPATCYVLPATCYLLPATCYVLPATCYLLPATCYLLPATCSLLPATCYPATLLPATYYLLPTPYLHASCAEVCRFLAYDLLACGGRAVGTQPLHKRLALLGAEVFAPQP